MAQRRTFFALAGAVGAGALLFSFTPKEVTNRLPNTPGVQNIEDRYTRGGGAPDHLPAGGTQLGTTDPTQSRGVTVEGTGLRRNNDKAKTVRDHD